MILKYLSRRWFWEIVAELFLLEFLIAFTESYEEARANVRRDLYGERREQPRT